MKLLDAKSLNQDKTLAEEESVPRPYSPPLPPSFLCLSHRIDTGQSGRDPEAPAAGGALASPEPILLELRST